MKSFCAFPGYMCRTAKWHDAGSRRVVHVVSNRTILRGSVSFLTDALLCQILSAGLCPGVRQSELCFDSFGYFRRIDCDDQVSCTLSLTFLKSCSHMPFCSQDWARCCDVSVLVESDRPLNSCQFENSTWKRGQQLRQSSCLECCGEYDAGEMR